MQTKRQVWLSVIVLAGWLPLPTSGAVTGETNRWSFDVVPYLWVAGIDVETSPSSASSDVERFDTRIRAGAMLATQVRYRSVGLLTDFAWVRLQTEAIDPGPAFSDVELQSDFIHATAALTYTLPLRGKLHADVLAGARFWWVSEDLEFKSGVLPGFDTSEDKSWVDPVVGASLRYDFSRRWFASVAGNVGGFGVSADIAWEVFSGVGYRFTQGCSATLGYRYLHEDYDRGDFDLKLDAHGFLLGVGFHF